MNKIFLWGVATCLAAISTPSLFWLGSTVTAKTLKLYELTALNPNNILGKICGALLVAAIAKEAVTKAQFLMPLYQDIANHLLAAVFKSPRALFYTRAFSYQQVRERLKTFIYPKLKVIATGMFVLLLLTVFTPLPFAFLCGVYLISIVVEVSSEGRIVPWNQVVRGFTRRDGVELARKWIGKNTAGLIRWGASFIPKSNEALHYLIIGVTGAGKSIWQESMMKVALPGNKGIVNDPKPSQSTGMVPLLEGLGINYYILNPFDARAYAWDIARDIQTPDDATELASHLFPVNQHTTEGRFFDEGGKLADSMKTTCLQIAKPGAWTLREYILFSQQPYFEALIRKYHPRPHEFDEFLKAKKIEGERNDILLTLQAKVLQLAPIAARWELTTQKIAFRDYVLDKSPGNTTIVIGSDPKHEAICNLANTFLFAFFARHLKSLPPNPHRRIWIFLDEAASEETPPWPKIESIMALGRSAGVSCCFAFHNISLLKRTYGELVAHGIFALARHKAFFGLDNETSEFVSHALGNYEYVEKSYNSSTTTNSNNGTSYSQGTSTRLGSRPIYLPQELQDMNRPPTGVENGFVGDFIAPGEGIHRHHYTWTEVVDMLPKRSQEVEAFLPGNETMLQPFSEDELKFFFPEGIKPHHSHHSKRRNNKNR
jgi:hypothetical protein